MDNEAIVRIVPVVAAVIAVVLVHQFIIKPKVMKVGGKKSPLEAVRFFRKLGFFEGYEASSDEELAAGIEKKHEEVWGGPLDPRDPLFDQYLLVWDKKRVWCKVVDAAVGDDAYIKALKEWAAISKGAFDPQDIRETWESSEGPVEVAYRVGEQEYISHPQVLESGHLDDGIAGEVIEATKNSDYHLLKLFCFTPAPYILFLSWKEWLKLKTERRWELKKLVYDGSNLGSLLRASVDHDVPKF